MTNGTSFGLSECRENSHTSRVQRAGLPLTNGGRRDYDAHGGRKANEQTCEGPALVKKKRERMKREIIEISRTCLVETTLVSVLSKDPSLRLPPLGAEQS